MILGRRTILLLGTAVIATVVLGRNDARAEGRPPRRIGFFTGGPPDVPSPYLARFVTEMAALGWTEGRDYEVLYRGGAGRAEHYPALVGELIAADADLLIVHGPAELSAARLVTTSLPIVFVDVPDPVALGAVESLARPGRNATGLSSIAVELAGKRLELLAETVPALRRVGELMTPGLSNGEAKLAGSRAAAARFNGALEVVAVVVRDANTIESALIDAAGTGIDGLLVQLNAITVVHRERLVRLIAAHRLPAIYEDSRFVAAGGLMSYGGDATGNYQRAASYVDRILKGAQPGDLPVEQATRFELVINAPVARALGLTISPALLARADEVIE